MSNRNNNRNRFVYIFFLIVVLVLISIIYASLAVNVGIKINKEKALTPDEPVPTIEPVVNNTPAPSNPITGKKVKPTPKPTPTPEPEPDIPVIIPDDINWEIEFKNIKVKNGSVTPITGAHILETKTDIAYEITLKEPGEYYGFSVDIVNEGNIDAKVYESVKSGINSIQSKYLTYEVTYDDGTPISINDVLNSGTKKRINVLVKFKDEVNQNDLPKQNQHLDLLYRVTFIEK